MDHQCLRCLRGRPQVPQPWRLVHTSGHATLPRAHGLCVGDVSRRGAGSAGCGPGWRQASSGCGGESRHRRIESGRAADDRRSDSLLRGRGAAVQGSEARAGVRADVPRRSACRTCASTRKATSSASGAAAQPRPHLVFAAHLDTVFPEGTDVTVKREGDDPARPGHRRRLPRPRGAPRGRARRSKKANMQTPGTITFVGNVGEEGLGDLRGVKYLFQRRHEGADRSVRLDRRHRPRHHPHRRRQPALPRDVQGTRRPQLRRVRHGQPDPGARPRDGEDCATSRCRAIRRRRSTSAASAAARRSTPFPSRRGWKWTCARPIPPR